MRLKICVPTEVVLEADVSKVVAEAANTACCLLRRHVDCAAAVRLFT
jgi:F0F1-type ATP synthase epsilon subunit